MGVYSSNRTTLNVNLESFVANENYVGPVGAIQAMIEGVQNEQSIFNAVIEKDIDEALAIASKDAAVLESLDVVNEGFGGELVAKIKEILKKLIEKIKGLVATFIAKIQNVFIRDNKKFVEKYKAEVIKKDLSKMKYKYSKPTGTFPDPAKVDVPFWSMFAGKTEDQCKEYIDKDITDDKYIEESLGKSIGSSSCTLSEYSKEVHEKMFESEDEKEGLTQGEIADFISDLVDSKKTIKDLKDTETKALKSISDALRSIDKAENVFLKGIPKDDGASASASIKDTDGKETNYTAVSGGKQVAVIRLNTYHRAISAFQTIMTKMFAVTLTEVKFGLAQDRRIFAKAAAFNPKSVKENALLVEAAGEASDYETDLAFDSYEI